MEELSLSDILTIFRRHRRIFLVTVAVLLAITFIFVANWSNYRATATVEIEQSDISENMTLPIGASPEDTAMTLADQRISQVEQNVTSLGSLAEIITKFNLYPRYRKSLPVASLANRMRDKIKLDFISSKISNPAAAQKETAEQLSAIAFTVSFDYNDPQMAEQVTNELVSRFLDEDLKLRRKKAQETSDFLASQIAALSASMADQEKRIADFRAKNGDASPETLMFNEQASANTNFNLQNIESQIATNEGTQGSLRAQLASIDPYSRVIADGQVMTTPAVQLKALESEYATLTAQYGPEYPDVVKVRGQIAALKAELKKESGGSGESDTSSDIKAQIADVETNLAAAEKTKGQNNPDVLALRHQLQSLKTQLANERQKKIDDFIKKDADNPAYLQVAEQLRAAEEQHQSLVAERDMLMAQEDKYQKNIAENPAVQQQMELLSRDYENSQLRYRELKEKKMQADMNAQLEEERKGQRLIVTNPPEVPRSTHPSRILLLLGGIVLSVMGGIGSVIISEALNQSVYGAHQLATVIGATPLVTIPYMFTTEEIEHVARLRAYAVKAAMVAGALIVVSLIFSVAL